MPVTRNPSLATILVTGYMVTGWILMQTDHYYVWGMGLYLFAPAPLAWLIYSVLKHGSYHGKDLDTNEEFGYQDKEKDSLGIW
jgi:hypothetical protein